MKKSAATKPCRRFYGHGIPGVKPEELQGRLIAIEGSRIDEANPRPTPAQLRKGLDGKTPVKKAKLQVLSGSFAGRELELNKALTTLGRPGIQVAAITRRQDGFFIVHVDSDTPNNYPLVNGTAIGSTRK